jgi:hypothetical protein
MALNRIFARTLFALLAIFSVLLTSDAAWAQTTGSIRGIVWDEEELELPGANVELSGDKLIGGAQTRTTGGDGAFKFVELPPGLYNVKVTKEGWTTVTATGIVVKVSRSTSQNVTLKPSSAVQEIEVTGTRPVVDTEDVSRGQVLTKEFLQQIPSGRSYQSAVQMASGVVGGSNPNMGGAAYNENTYMLDGANITDPVTGTFSLNFNYDAIQQIEVLMGGFMPEYGSSLGGIINLVTESGTNNLEFDTSVYYQNGNWRAKKDERFTADGYQLAPTDFDSDFQVLRIASMISGPVVRDRAWFVISYQATRSLIANTGIDLPRDYDAHYILAKLTVQPNSEHRFTAFTQLDPTAIDNLDQADAYQLPESQPRQYQGGYVVSGRWQWFLSPEANLDTMVVVQKTFIEVGPVPCTHDRGLGYHPCAPDEKENNVDWDTPGRIGTFGAYDSVNYTSYYIDDRFRYQASSKLSLLNVKDPLGGVHDLKMGVEVNQTVWDQTQGYTGGIYHYDLNENYFDPNTFSNYYWVETTGPIQFRTTGSQWNFFVQDSWKPISNLTIKGGVRYDHAVMRNDTGEPVINQGLWGPRLYAAWDPFGDEKTKIAGGYGRFNDTGRLATAAFTSANSYGYKLFLGEFFAGQGLEGNGFGNGQGDAYSYYPRENRNIAHDTLRTPRSDEFNLILNRELFEDVGISSELAYKMTRYIYDFDETNLIYDQDGSTIIGSRYADPNRNIYRLRTMKEARRNYLQWDLRLYKVQSKRWFGEATYSYTRSFGTSFGSLSGWFANDPQTQYNYGPLLTTDYRHVVKAFGAWSLPTDPWVQTLGFSFVYYSGPPRERYYYSDGAIGGYSLRIRPRGGYTRYPPYWELGLKFAQDFDVRKGKIILDFEARNVFNNRAADNLSGYIHSQNRLLITSRQQPLRLQLGLRYQF